MGNAEVIGNEISSNNGKKLFIKQYFAIAPAPESEHGLSINLWTKELSVVAPLANIRTVSGALNY